MLAFIYINEKDKNDSLRLSEETQILKEFQEKEKLRLQGKSEKNNNLIR